MCGTPSQRTVCPITRGGMSDSVLSSPAPDRDLIAARKVLVDFGVDHASAQIDRPGAACGFSGALILCVHHAGQRWCLRRWPQHGLPRRRLTALHHFVQSLSRAGIVEVAVPATSRKGESLVLHQGRLWQLEPWMPGRADFHESPSDQKLQSAMQALARLHRAAAQYDPPEAARTWFDRHQAAPSPACRERLGIIAHWSPSRCQTALRNLMSDANEAFRRLALEVLQQYESLRDHIEPQLQAQSRMGYRLHPCLRDVWHDHLLFTGQKLTGLIDLSAARKESVAADLSRLLGSLLSDDRARWEFALDCYHDVRPLTTDERKLIRVLDRSGVLLSGLTWITRRLQGELTDDQLPRVIERLEVLRQRLDVLADSRS